MKRFVVIFAVIAAVFLGISPISAYAEEQPEVGEDILRELDEILGEYAPEVSSGDLSSLSFGEILGFMRDRLADRLDAPRQLLVTLFLVVVSGAVMRSFAGAAVSEQSADIYGMVCVMAAAAVIMPRLLAIYREVLGIVELCGGFVAVFVPVLTTVAVCCGKFTAAGVCHGLILTASELMVQLSGAYLMPVLTVMAALAVTGSVFPESSMDGLAAMLKKGVTWLMTAVMTLFSGFVTLKCSIAGKADGAAVKTAKMLVSGFVPIVGGAVSDAYSTVKGSFEVIGGTVGTAGIVGIAVIMLPMVMELVIYRAVMWIGAAASDIFSAAEIGRLLRAIDGGLAIAQGVLVSYLVMFVVCAAILMQTLG